MKQLRGYIRSCDSLEQEIIQKEHLRYPDSFILYCNLFYFVKFRLLYNARMKLTSMAMDICNVLNEEIRVGLGHCETEARRKIEFILQVFQQASEGRVNQSLPEELLLDLRRKAKTQLELDVLELTKSRKVLAGLNQQSLEQPSMVSSLSGSEDSFLHSSTSLEKSKGQTEKPIIVSIDPTSLLPVTKKPFKDIKDSIVKNKANEVLRAKLHQLKTIVDHYNPKIQIIFDKLRSERDEEVFDPENPIQEPDESPEIVNTISSLRAVKHLQMTAAETITESIVLVIFLFF